MKNFFTLTLCFLTLSLTAHKSYGQAVSAGAYYSLAINKEGKVVAWGDNDKGQCVVPSQIRGAVAVSAGESHSLAIDEDGMVVAWGYNASGQCDVPYGLKKNIATSVSAGRNYSSADHRFYSLKDS